VTVEKPFTNLQPISWQENQPIPKWELYIGSKKNFSNYRYA
jgi:hypothetical protein